MDLATVRAEWDWAWRPLLELGLYGPADNRSAMPYLYHTSGQRLCRSAQARFARMCNNSCGVSPVPPLPLSYSVGLLIENMSSKDYELFIWSCFPKDFHAAREGLVHDSLLRLEGNEKQMAIDLLMGRLNRYLRWKWMKIEDRVIEAVGWFKLGEAVAPLQRLLRITKSPILKAQIGLSLYRISGYPQGVELAIEAFDRIPIYNQYNRLRCAEYLSIYAKEYKSAVKRLLKAVDDRDDFVAVYSIGLIKFAFEGKSQIISLVDTIIGTLGEHKEREPNEIITRKTALLRISDLIEIEFESDRKWL